jgi:hypothetical protein
MFFNRQTCTVLPSALASNEETFAHLASNPVIPHGIDAKKNCHSRRALDSLWPMRTILIIILIIFLFGALPTWPYSSGWGYYPSGGIGLVLLIVLILWLMGRI